MEQSIYRALNFDVNQAACRGSDINLFYPNTAYKNSRGGSRFYQNKAITICSSCSVKDECLEYSLHYEPCGVWGGKTEIERDIIRRQRGISLPADCYLPDSVKRERRRYRIPVMNQRVEE